MNTMLATPFGEDLFNHVATRLDPTILAHSQRVYTYASNIATLTSLRALPSLRPTAPRATTENFRPTDPGPTDIFLPSSGGAAGLQPIDSRLLFAACMFHDMGTCRAHDSDQRFEVCGADAAVAYLAENGRNDTAELQSVWEAIALHTSPGIAERMGPLVRLVRFAVLADFGHGWCKGLLYKGVVEHTEGFCPRGEIEKLLADYVARQAERREGHAREDKAPKTSWVGGLVRFRLENPGWEGINGEF